MNNLEMPIKVPLHFLLSEKSSLTPFVICTDDLVLLPSQEWKTFVSEHVICLNIYSLEDNEFPEELWET